MTRNSEAWLKFFATRFIGVGIDSIIVALAHFSAFALRFDFREPQWGWRAVALSLVTVIVVHLITLICAGCYARPWRVINGRDFPNYAIAAISAALILTAMRFFTPTIAFAHIRPPYSVTVIECFLSPVGFVFVRFIWRLMNNGRNRESKLLEREVKHFDSETAARFLCGKTVLVTGAGGSIGSEIVRQVATAGVKRLLMVERSENALYEIDKTLRNMTCKCEYVPLMIDINCRETMERIFADEKPQIVLHAAAYKHVPMVEANPAEGWRNNTEATRSLGELSVQYGVERFVMISTDKAVNPVSVMGKTKLAAEKAIMALNGNGATSFCAVRFGNVLGSSGSVVQLFREQILQGQPLTVTHPDMKRYFMTVNEAVSLVLQAASRSERAIYTLDMGKPVRIVDLAESMIVQAGYRPYVDIPIVFTGIRPGEKLFEEIDVSEKSCYKTDMAKIYITRNTEK